LEVLLVSFNPCNGTVIEKWFISTSSIMEFFKKIGLGAVIFTLVFTIQSCGEEEVTETHFTGVWKINRYNVSGMDVTDGYIKSHKDYSIYVKPGHTFSETWIEENEPRSIQGNWNILDGGKNIILTDTQYGERIYDLNYMYTLKYNTGNEEVILRKI